ncbi:MAG: type I toxin-antitoxin system SymE family toxin [Lachnospiraceae bacterium]|nr:type I toxin-antitoxin system SymE family toxin [Lachnospiraceae bacterium]
MDDLKRPVYCGRGTFKKSLPQILLQGKWLEQACFSTGNKIAAKCQQGRLIIIEDETRTDTEE